MNTIFNPFTLGFDFWKREPRLSIINIIFVRKTYKTFELLSLTHKNRMPYVTFKLNGRTGNIMIGYLFAKVVSLTFGHLYIPYEEIPNQENVFVINESNAREVLTMKPELSQMNIICDGYFQQSDYYTPIRETLLEIVYNTNDYWFSYTGRKEYMKDFLECGHSLNIGENDLVVSLRLDDFIQLPCPKSDILPPQYYLDVLENIHFDKLYIVCDAIRHTWEQKYIEHFSKWKPVLLQESVMHDCGLMRDCHTLVHSNSTLCWMMSFLSKTKKLRIMPDREFYPTQSLGKIEERDTFIKTSTLSHHDVYHIDLFSFLKKSIHPLSYCIPDECIVGDEVLNHKTRCISDLIPGNRSTYTFGADDEVEYNKMYQSCLFAHTQKKGGWDCLRHYEIMANGCIPIFNDIANCPESTLTTMPKQLIQEANRELLPWNYNNKPLYDSYVKKMLQHLRENCSASGTARYFLDKIGGSPKNVLLIMGNIGVNYTRETFWIGMKRHIQSIGGVAVEYPKIDFLYDNYSGNRKTLYGNGFTYSCRLRDDYSFTNDEMVEKIKNKFFDLVIYGKVGPDELHEGSHPNMPLWEHVFKRYSRNQIVYLYGGDECIDLTYDNRYKEHIMIHSQFAHCFVREYKK